MIRHQWAHPTGAVECCGCPLSRAAQTQEHRMDRRTDPRDVNATRIPLLGLLACALAVIQIFAMLAAKALYTIGGRYRDLGKSVAALALNYGLALDVLAMLVAILAIVFGGPNRRIGYVAIALVALSLALLFF